MTSQYNLLRDIDNTELNYSVKHNHPEKCKDNIGSIEDKLTIIHQNIRSIQKNFDNFAIFLTRLNFAPDLIILTECRLSDKTPKFDLNNYECFYSQHYLNQSDGIAVFYKSGLQVTINEPPFQDANCLTISIADEFTICGIYRSPSHHNIQNFCTSLEKIMQTCNTPSCVIIGDMNIDIKVDSEDKRANDYLDITGHYGFYPGHLFPTHDSNCLDHVMLKTAEAARVIVCDLGLTDHDTLVVAMNKNTSCITPNLNKVRYINKINYTNLIKDVESTDWSFVYDHNDISDALTDFTSILSSKIQSHSTKVKQRNSKAIRKPWMSDNLLKCIRKRDLLHKEAKKKENKNDLSVQLKYKNYRNYCNNTIQNLKNAYERQLLHRAKGDNKRTWAAVKDICNIKRKSSPSADLLCAQQDPVDSLNVVNNYFSTVGDQLAEKTMTQLQKTESDLVNMNHLLDGGTTSQCQSFFIQPTDEVEIGNIISHLKSDSAPGWDGISNQVLKSTKHCLAAPIAFLCNLSFTTGSVPSDMKMANVCPIYKSGEKQLASNYRPISLLSSLSKIIEKVMNKRLLKYLEELNIFSENQYGFRNGKSTEDAVTKLVDSVIAKLDRGYRCAGVFLDLAKAFDTVSRPLLLDKMERLGLRGTALDWFSSYLSDRKQRVCVGEHLSDYAYTRYGIPQGSVIGPTLFIIYINGLCKLNLDSAEMFAYADDTAILFYGKTWKDAHTAAETGMQIVANWLGHNLLTLNMDKTKVVNFSVTERTIAPSPSTIKLHVCGNINVDSCECPTFEQTRYIKYLGVYIDQHLTWTKQIDCLSSRVRKLMHVFRKLSSISDIDLMKSLYLALCQSVLCYCTLTWGAACKTHLIKAERAQRAILKVIYKKRVRYCTNELYRETGMMRVRQLYVIAVTLKFHQTALLTTQQSQRSQRKLKWQKKTCKLHFGRRSFLFMGPHIYSKINDLLEVVQLTRHKCKSVLSKWLSNLDYTATENLISV